MDQGLIQTTAIVSFTKEIIILILKIRVAFIDFDTESFASYLE